MVLRGGVVRRVTPAATTQISAVFRLQRGVHVATVLKMVSALFMARGVSLEVKKLLYGLSTVGAFTARHRKVRCTRHEDTDGTSVAMAAAAIYPLRWP